MDAEGRLSSIQLLCLTISLGGLQTIWTAIMSQGSPYLLSLGMDPSFVSLVWLAGPLSGMLVQPYIGILSDSCTHPWGRRRPFIVGGTVSTVTCMMVLPWTREIVEVFCGSFGGDPYGRAVVIIIQVLAAFWVWCMQIAIQPLQCGIRALIVDQCPQSQQVLASAYASRVVGVGSILGYSTAFINLPLILPLLGNTQFKALCLVSSVGVVLTVAIQCLTIHEEPSHGVDADPKKRACCLGPFKDILLTIETMPKKIKRVCIVQSFAWLAWFPFLYYITTYIGDLIRHDTKTLSNSLPRQKVQVILADATRFGTLSLVFFATTAFTINLILPFFISQPTSTDGNQDYIFTHEERSTSGSRFLSTSALKSSSSAAAPKFTVRRAWIASHILAAATFFSIGLTKDHTLSTILISILGISWALTQWAPFALIGAELTKSRDSSPLQTPESLYTSIPASPDSEDDVVLPSLSTDLEQHGLIEEKNEVQAGSVMGVHNMAISAPQIVAAVGSSALFWTLQKWNIVGVDAMGILLMFGVLPSAIAAWLAIGIEET
ncbi:hypothetical protein BGZ60DRAFT_390772 [Tricladium varicosporioides]|nr:hypothetical protein BGZ60DRAFT_390772 [Hymenoscyphus varicosporioides]